MRAEASYRNKAPAIGGRVLADIAMHGNAIDAWVCGGEPGFDILDRAADVAGIERIASFDRFHQLGETTRSADQRLGTFRGRADRPGHCGIDVVGAPREFRPHRSALGVESPTQPQARASRVEDCGR